MRKSERRIQKYGKCMKEGCENYRKALPVVGEMICPKCKQKLIECPPPPPPTPIWKYAAGGCLALAVCVGGYYGISSWLNSSDTPKPVVEENQGAANAPEQLPQTANEPKGKQQEEPKAQTDDDGEKLVDQTLKNKEAAEAEAAAKAKAEAEAKAKAAAEAKKKKQQTASSTTTTPATTPAPAGSINLGYATYTGQTKNGKPHGKGKLVYKQTHKIVASQSHTAAPGDTYEGQFRDGKVSGGPGVWTHGGVQTTINP